MAVVAFMNPHYPAKGLVGGLSDESVEDMYHKAKAEKVPRSLLAVSAVVTLLLIALATAITVTSIQMTNSVSQSASISIIIVFGLAILINMFVYLTYSANKRTKLTLEEYRDYMYVLAVKTWAKKRYHLTLTDDTLPPFNDHTTIMNSSLGEVRWSESQQGWKLIDSTGNEVTVKAIRP